MLEAKVETMKILVAGSIDTELSEVEQEEFKAGAKELGRAIIENGHTLIISSDRSDTVDAFAFEGAIASNKKGRVKIYYHEAKPPPFKDAIKKVQKNITFEYERVNGGWATGRVPQILYCDGIIMLGGAQKTAQFAHLAPYLHKPYLPLPCFGGVSSELWPALRNHYKSSGLFADNKDNVIETWAGKKSIEAALEGIDELANSSIFDGNTSKEKYGLIISIALSLAVWISIFSIPIKPGIFTLFVLLILSAYLGRCLKVLTESKDNSKELTRIELFSNSILSVLLGFFLFVLYLGGGLSINGDFKFLSQTGIDDSFRRLAVTMTLLGGASGFLTEKITVLLKKKLGEFVG